MPIYEDGKYQAFYIGDMHPVKIMDGNDVIVQAKPLELTGTALAFEDTYNDTVQGLMVFGKSEQVQTVQGKNLFDKNRITNGYRINNTTGGLTARADTCASDYIPIIAGNSYRFSGFTYINGSQHGAFYDANKQFVSGFYNTTTTGVVPVGVSYFRYTVPLVDIETTQLELGSTATAYAPFVPNSPSHDYPSPIASVGDTNGVTVIATDGDTQSVSATRSVVLRSTPSGVRDTLNGITGEIERNIATKVLTRSDAWSLMSSAVPNTIRLLCSSLSIMQGTRDVVGVLSNMFKAITWPQMYNGTDATPNAVSDYTDHDFHYFYVRISTAYATDLSSFYSFLDANPVTVLYQLAAPTTEAVDPITLPTYPGQTHIDAGGAELAATCRVVDL